jgi:hypothetical protein
MLSLAGQVLRTVRQRREYIHIRATLSIPVVLLFLMP